MEVAVSTPGELLELLALGMRARATSATGVHNQSSRSHALCYIRVREGRYSGTVDSIHSNPSLASGPNLACAHLLFSSGHAVACGAILGTLLLIDLAGSERNEDSWTYVCCGMYERVPRCVSCLSS